MDTYEARMRMRDLAADALEIVGRFREGKAPSGDDRSRLRSMVQESRALLGDAGYPGEAAWRGLQRSSLGADTYFNEADTAYWLDVAGDLQTAIETLDSLVSGGLRDADLHIIG